MNQQEEVVAAEQESQEEMNDTIQITNLDQFATLVGHWHAKQVATINHISQMPPGQTVEIEGEPPFVLEGDVMRGFKLGLATAMNYLGTLPFMAEHDTTEQSVH